MTIGLPCKRAQWGTPCYRADGRSAALKTDNDGSLCSGCLMSTKVIDEERERQEAELAAAKKKGKSK